jgi:hypothetical protein
MLKAPANQYSGTRAGTRREVRSIRKDLMLRELFTHVDVLEVGGEEVGIC